MNTTITDNYLSPKNIVKVFSENARTYKHFYDKGYFISNSTLLNASNNVSNYLPHSNRLYFNFYLSQSAIYNISQQIVLRSKKTFIKKSNNSQISTIPNKKVSLKNSFLKRSKYFKSFFLSTFDCINKYLIKGEVNKDLYEMKKYSAMLFGKRVFNRSFKDLSEMTSLISKGHLELKTLNFLLCKIFGSLNPRKQKKFFVFINRYFNYVVKTYSSHISGIGLQVNGRLYNKARSSEYKASFGTFRKNTLDCKLKVSKYEVKHPSLGTFGFKLTFIFAD